MKYTCKLLLSSFILIFYSLMASAQNTGDVARFLEGSERDASKLIEAYTAPIIKGMSYGFTGGWYHTGKAHKTLGVDLSVSLNSVFIPTSENYFNPNSLGLTTLEFTGNTTNPSKGSPTIFGPKDETTYTVPDPDGAGGPLTSYTFEGPEGLDIKNAIKESIGFAVAPVAVPIAQLGIGIYKGTDIKFRYLPELDLEGTKIKVIGFGLMHDVKQHIPGIKLLPFDLSALVGYNSISGETDLSGEFNGENQNMTYKFNSWTLQGIISKKVSVLTVYAGAGYNIVNTDLRVKGTYDVQGLTLENPVSIDFKNNSFSITTGLRLKLGPLFFNGDYTLQKFNRFTFGLGLAIR